MSKTLTVEGDLNAANILTNITTQGSVTAPSRVTPSSAKRITGILVAAAADQLAEGAACVLVRLGGNAIRRGEQSFIVAGLAGNTVVAGSDLPPVYNPMFMLMDADIEVDGSEVIDINAEIVGDDLGDTTIVITLIFD